jgi:hypothetical protein
MRTIIRSGCFYPTQLRWSWDSWGLLSQGSPALRDNPGLVCAIPLGLDTVAEYAAANYERHKLPNYERQK